MEIRMLKRVALCAVLAVLFAGSMQLVVTDLQARGGGGGHAGGGHGGGHGGGGHHGGGHGGGGHHGGGHGHGGHGHHGGHGYNHGGYGRGGYGGYGYGGGGYWNNAGLWVPLAVGGGVALGAAAAGSYDDGYTESYSDGQFDDADEDTYAVPSRKRARDAYESTEEEAY